MLRLSVLVFSFFASGAFASGTVPKALRTCAAWLNPVSDEELQALPYLSVPDDITHHSIERRGFVQVPVRYGTIVHGGTPKIKIFYRLIPALGTTVRDPSKPVALVINGGPGYPSSIYRKLHFNYRDAQELEKDKLQYLLRDFHVLLVDQRGTHHSENPGFSAPLDFDNPEINIRAVARFFGPDEQARDHHAVVKEVLAPGQDYIVIGQSYGGAVVSKWIASPLLRDRPPKGFVFSSAFLPHEDVEEHSNRRREQLRLQLLLKEKHPELVEKTKALAAHFDQIGINPNFRHVLWTFLGQGPDWVKELSDKIDELQRQSREEVLRYVAGEMDSGLLLNYILSSRVLTPGYTDRSMNAKVSAAIPFEDWMLDENWVLDQVGLDGGWKEQVTRAMDASPPPAIAWPSVPMFQKYLQQTRTLFTFADDDILVPKDSQIALTKKYYWVPGQTDIVNLSGGHRAIFSEAGWKAIHEWYGKLPPP